MSWNKPEMEKLLFSPDGSSHRSLTQRQLPYGSLESVSPNGNPKLILPDMCSPLDLWCNVTPQALCISQAEHFVSLGASEAALRHKG